MAVKPKKPKLLKIVYKDPNKLIPYVMNAKKHSDAQVDLIAASIAEFGFNAPILLDGDNGLIAGHGRLLGALKLGIDSVPTIELSHLSELQKKAYVLADNRLGEIGTEWDFDLVSAELEAIDEEPGLDLGLTGFDESFILDGESLLAESEEDAAPDLPEEPICKLGDRWLLGEHVLLCGDSTSSTDMDSLMGKGNVADFVFTDPPYGIEYQGNWREKGKKFDVLKNDDTIVDIAPVLEIYSTGWMFIWTTWKVVDKWIAALDHFGYPTNMVVWSKGGGGIGDLKKTFSTDYEIALVFNRGASLQGKRIGSVWKINKDSANDYKHPTQKPVELAEEAIDKTTKKGELVLDIFAGSGSTLIACEKTSRTGRFMELDPRYCDVILERWQNYTGAKAIHEESKTSFDSMSSAS